MWASNLDRRPRAVENAHGLGQHLALWLAARGEQVQDCHRPNPSALAPSRRKNGVIDASVASIVAALSGDGNPVMAEALAAAMVILDERRNNVTTHRTWLINQLPALLRDLIPGGADRNLTATAAVKLLAPVRPSGAAETARKQLCRDLIGEIKGTDQRLKSLHHSDRGDSRRARQPPASLPSTTAPSNDYVVPPTASSKPVMAGVVIVMSQPPEPGPHLPITDGRRALW